MILQLILEDLMLGRSKGLAYTFFLLKNGIITMKRELSLIFINMKRVRIVSCLYIHGWLWMVRCYGSYLGCYIDSLGQ